MTRKSPRQRSLFGGYAPPPRDARGRKRIAWSEQVAEKVAALAAREKTQEEIAEAVALSVKTLTRIYADELERGRDLIRQAVFETQLKQAVKGSTSAAKFVVAELDRQALEEGVYRGRRERRSAPKLGKKEERQLAAEGVGGKFAPGQPPLKLTH